MSPDSTGAGPQLNAEQTTPGKTPEQIDAERAALLLLQSRLEQKDHTIDSLSAQLAEIHSSTAWKIVQRGWALQTRLRAFRPFRWTERTFKAAFSRSRLAAPAPTPQAAPTPQIACDNTETLIAEYLLSPSDRRVLLLAPTFFDWNGNNMFYGGAERYLIELARLIAQQGYEAVIVQCGHFNWMRYYYDVRVIGLKVDGPAENLTRKIEQLQPKAALVIYSPFFLASGQLDIPSIAISHGIYWDHQSFHESPAALEKTIANLLNGLAAADRIVSVDTNTLNWMRTTQSELAAKATYIPNFVDLNQFQPAAKAHERIIILYPRRLYRPRGFWLVADLLPEIVEKYPRVDFHFVGKGDAPEEARVQEWMQRYPGRIKHYFLSPEEMHLAYQQADITLIPTVHSEGTSLSCLEAMASKNAVIATNVGGLVNLVLNGHNGLLIEPRAAALKEAIETLLDQPELRQRLAENGRQVVERSFTLERWRKQWQAILSEFLPARVAQETRPVKTLVFLYSGIAWEGIKQRPHHLAAEFVKKGYEVFWLDPQGRRTPAPQIHLLDQNDDLYLENALLLIYYPYNYEEIRKFKNPTVVYDLLDDISIFDHVTWDLPGKTARDYYVRLLQRADIMLCSSRVLLNQIRELRPDALYVPNGVYLDHFNPDHFDIAEEIRRFPHPLVGFHGAIAEWVDVRLVLEVARLRPAYHFVLVGPVSIPNDVVELKRQANIHFIDSVPYELIPSYIKGFDVGIMPFKLSKLTHAVRPLKILEYLSMQKPVVATPIEELKDWPGVLLAATPGDFAARIDEALQAGGIVGDPQTVAAFLKGSTWPEVVRPLMEKLKLA